MITGKLDQPRPFGRFLLVAKIASGGMATVYRAEVPHDDPLHGKSLALKILHDHLSENPEFIRMFKDEGRIARDFEHPNVVRVFEVGEVDGAHFLAMEFVEGRDLAQLLVAHRMNQQVMAAPVAFEIMRQALMALRYVHAFKGKNGRLQGIVHRDISPQNLLISRQPQVKVTDFGIARGEHRSDRTRTGTVKGKMHYMAPEQASGLRVDARADLYSLGAVAYEMLTGQPLFGPGTTEVLQSRAMQGKIEYGKKFDRLTDDIQAWLRKALATNPDERFHSADAMLAAMEQIPKASQNHYRPEQLVRLMDLPEASRSKQRAARLFASNDAAAHTGRISAGAVLSSASPSRQSQLPPGNHVELDRGSRDNRLRQGEQKVDWSGGDLPMKPVTSVREGNQPGVKDQRPVENRKAARADVLPAEAATGKNYAANRDSLVIAAKNKGEPLDVLDPGSFKRPAPVAAESLAHEAPAANAQGRAARAQAKTSAGILAREQQGMALASFVAWSCGALVLFAVLMEVTGVQVKLPEVTDEKLAALFDDDAPVTRTDAVTSPRAGVRSQGAVSHLRPSGSLQVASAAAMPGEASPTFASHAKSTPNVFAVPVVAPAAAKPTEPEPSPVLAAAVRAKAEQAAVRAVHANAERAAWADRPLERVAKPGDNGPLDPEAAPAREKIAAKVAKVDAVAKASAPVPAVAKAVTPGADAATASGPGRLGRILAPAVRSEQVVVHVGAGAPAVAAAAKGPVVPKPVVRPAAAPVMAKASPAARAPAPVMGQARLPAKPAAVAAGKSTPALAKAAAKPGVAAVAKKVAAPAVGKSAPVAAKVAAKPGVAAVAKKVAAPAVGKSAPVAAKAAAKPGVAAVAKKVAAPAAGKSAPVAAKAAAKSGVAAIAKKAAAPAAGKPAPVQAKVSGKVAPAAAKKVAAPTAGRPAAAAAKPVATPNKARAPVVPAVHAVARKPGLADAHAKAGPAGHGAARKP